MDDLFKELAKPFPKEDLEWRIGQSGVGAKGPWAKILAYVTNRAIMQRLDDVVGPGNWRNEEPKFVTLATKDGVAVSGVLCGLSIWREGPGWITKWDGAEPSDIEPLKGSLSASMKRAAVLWGIGRDLYDLPETWAEISTEREQGPGWHWATTKDRTGAKVEFWWRVPALAGGVAPVQAAAATATERTADTDRAPTPGAKPAGWTGKDAPTEKQVAFYKKLFESSVFAPGERARAMEWLGSPKATRQAIKDQIDWAKRQVETRRPTPNSTGGTMAPEPAMAGGGPGTDDVPPPDGPPGWDQ